MIAPPAATQTPESDRDMALGDSKAPIVLIEYGSPTCPACKAWHDDVLPVLLREYVETRKVLFVFRELPSHNKAVDTAVFALARCAGRKRYFSVLDLAFTWRDRLDASTRNAEGAAKELQAFARNFEITADKFKACVDSPEHADRLAHIRQEAIARGVTGTPTFFVNGREVMSTDTANAERFMRIIGAAVRGMQPGK